MSETPVSRTLEKLRDEGGHPEIVEKWIPRGHGFKLDLYGIVDIEALFPDHTLYVQVCRDADLLEHYRTCYDEPRLPKLIACPTRMFEIWSWKKRGRTWSERRLRAHRGERGGVVFVEAATAISPENPMEAQTSAVEVGR